MVDADSDGLLWRLVDSGGGLSIVVAAGSGGLLWRRADSGGMLWWRPIVMDCSWKQADSGGLLWRRADGGGLLWLFRLGVGG